MPNWCENTLYVSGPEDVLNDFLNKFDPGETGEFLFNNLLPVPEDIEDERAWKINNWGVKWEPSNLRYTVMDKNSVKFEFETPWGAPIDIIYTMSDEFPELEFDLRYLEDSIMNTKERVIIEKGERQLWMKKKWEVITSTTPPESS